MTKSARPTFRTIPALLFPLALGLALLFWPGRSLRSDNFIFYMPGARHVVPLEVIESTKYLPLLQVLNLVGKVAGIQEKKKTLKVWFGNTTLDLRVNEKRVGVDKATVDLAQPVLTSSGQWMVPVDFLTAVLPKLTHQGVEYQVGTDRIFFGDVKPGSFTVRLDSLPGGTRLTLQFTDKVSVHTAASDGKWVLFLGDSAIEPLEQTYQFKDPYISELRFDDRDGVPKLILTPSSGGLNFYPALVEGGKVLLADVIKPPPGVAQAHPTEQPVAPPSSPQAPAVTEQPHVNEEVPAAQPGPPLPIVVLDAGHGGDDSGARSRDGVLEKDLVAQLVARVRLALLSTQKFRIVLTRTGDTNPTFEQRALTANVAPAAFFVSFHAGDLGSATPRIAPFTYLSSPPLTAPSAAEAPPTFIPWTQVQQTQRDKSQQLGLALQQQFNNIPSVRVDPLASAPVRILRSINAPAVAVEIGTLAPDENAGALASPNFLQQVAAAVAKALMSLSEGGA